MFAFLQQNTGGVANGYGPASFVLPLGDLGAGAADTTAQGGGSTTATFTRATTAWTKLSTGLWASVASGTARSSYLSSDTTVGSYGGYLSEGARTNSCLQARDFTNASWTATSTTTAKNAIGIDGVASSASTLTTTGANGTVTQAFTILSAAKTFSVWIKRKTGTGTILITLDNFVTTTDVTASINSSTYTRVSMTQTLANPTVGIKIVTSTDAILVDMAQLEDSSSFASSPIPTTTIAVTRNADILTYPATVNILSATGTFYVEFNIPRTVADEAYIAAVSASDRRLLDINSGANMLSYDGTNTTAQGNGSQAANVSYKYAFSWGVAGLAAVLNGAAAVTAAFAGSMVATGNIYVGSRNDSAIQPFGFIKNFRIYPTQLSAAQLQAMTT